MQFNISFDVADSPDLGSLTASEQQAVLSTANAAANIWSWYLTPTNVTLDLSLIVDNSLFSGTTLAEGGPEAFYRTGGSFSGKPVYQSGTEIELRTGRDMNGTAPDLHIELTVNSIRNLLTFKTDDTAAVTRNRDDALSVFLHEIGHGLGFSSFDGDSSAASIYDTFIQNGYFTGTNAESAAGTPSGVPLEPDSLSHIAESGAFGADLMSPLLPTGTNIHISALDLAILQDIGVPIRQATSGADVMHALFGAPLHLSAGDDTGYATNGGSAIYGEDGNDQLYGGKGNDTLYGGSGLDTAHYSSLASNYQTTRLSAISFQVKDMRTGSPDGTDILTDVEQVQWSDGSFSTLIASASRRPGDFDGDGKADVLWQNNDGTAAIWTMSGATRLGGDTLSPNPGPSWHVIGSGDFNGDGKADVLWQNNDGTAAVWLMNGTTRIGGDTLSPNPGAAWHVKGAGDFNGDDMADVLWQNNDGTVAVWTMNGTNRIGGEVISSNPGSAWHVIGSGDFNGDAKADILFQNDDGRAAVWLVNGFSLLQGAAVGSNPGPTWHVKGAGDFDGDGKSDILWQNDDGRAAIWFMDGATVKNDGVLAINPGPSWVMKGAGDANGDGKADILWQNNLTGEPAVWLMSGFNKIGGDTLSPNPSTAWHLIANAG